MSTSITKSDGLVVVTQVFSQEESGKVRFPTTAVAQPWQSRGAVAGQVSDRTSTFLRGEPQSLGIVQMFIGAVCMLTALAAIFPSQHVHAPLFMGVAFVISGSLCVAARKGTNLGLIKGTLAVNIISAIVSLIGIGYLCVLLATHGEHEDSFCDLSNNINSMRSRSRDACIAMASQLRDVLTGIQGLLLVLTVLESCVSVTVCVFSGKAIRLRGTYTRPTVVASGLAAMTSDDCEAALLDSSAEDTPPAYCP